MDKHSNIYFQSTISENWVTLLQYLKFDFKLEVLCSAEKKMLRKSIFVNWKITTRTTGERGYKFELFEVYWTIFLVYPALSCSIFVCLSLSSLSQCILVYLNLSWSFSIYLGLSWTISDYQGLSGTFLDYIRLASTILDYLGQSVKNWDYLWLSGTI